MHHGGVPATPVPLPGPGLVLLIGDGAVAAAGRAFPPDEVVPADEDAAEHLADRLELGLVTAVPIDPPDASAIRRLVGLAHDADRPVDAIVLPGVAGRLPAGRIRTVTEVADPVAFVVVRLPASWDHRDRTGPFDLVGDVHGCLGELVLLLTQLGYRCRFDARDRPVGARHPEGRTAVFTGDLVDRGPDVPGTLRLVMGMLRDGDALAVCGNHDDKLRRALLGNDVEAGGGLDVSLEQLGQESAAFREEVRQMIGSLPMHLVLDGGRLVVAHAGLAERFHGRESDRVRALCLFGPTTGATDADGLPVRLPWADAYRGDALVVYGHTPTADPVWRNRTICIDGGCVFGGSLTAVRYPERSIVRVPALAAYGPPARPFLPAR